MKNTRYDDRDVADARRLNKLVEDDWAERLARGLPASGRAEQIYRQEQRDKLGR